MKNLGLCSKCKEWYYNPDIGYCHYCWAKKWFSWIVEPISKFCRNLFS